MAKKRNLACNQIEDNMLEHEWQVTEDGSPTLLLKGDGGSESMHHRKGALAESLYIYFDAVQFAEKLGWAPKFLSVGLGLGYNELIIAAYWARKGETSNPPYLESFEREPLLVENFVLWLKGESSPWETQYDQIAKAIGEKFEVSPDVIKATLVTWLNEQNWNIRGTLDQETKFSKQFSCVFYDAFSSKTNPELWSPTVLEHILKQAMAPQSVLCTYAATGELNRRLRDNGFILEDRPGFGGKRQSTFAIRNIPAV